MKDGKLQFHFGPTDFYLRAACRVAAKNPEFDASNDMLITKNDKRSFNQPHKSLIYDKFKVIHYSKYGDVQEKFHFYKIQDLRPLNTC